MSGKWVVKIKKRKIERKTGFGERELRIIGKMYVKWKWINKRRRCLALELN